MRSFAWWPKTVLDMKTGDTYRVWLEFYYKNKIAHIDFQGELSLLHKSSINKLPWDELETLESHPAHGKDWMEYYKKLHNKAIEETDPYTLMRKEIQDTFNGSNNDD